MKLRNKKTGEIGYPYFQNWKEITCVIVDENAKQIAEYTSLAELNEEWEDMPEEPKEYWFIDFNGEIKEFEVLGFEWQGWMKEIGNYFETKEEAEKAVEKLKAWKRLKDKGFKFQGWEDLEAIGLPINHYNNIAGFRLEDNHDVIVDLNTLFGGEE